jgi:23S rRNA (uracil1939-C5)-methyltransferase
MNQPHRPAARNQRSRKPVPSPADKTKTPDILKKQSLVELDIVDLAYGGNGVAKVDGFVVFVSGAVPGDRVLARIVRRQKNHAEAEVEKFIQASPERVEPPCPIFGVCGGCSWQNLPYSVQLAHKQKQAEEVLERIGGVRPDVVRPIIPSPLEWRYRNKMDFTFGFNDQGEPVLGFHKPGQFWRIIEVRQCLLQPEPIDRLISAMGDWMRKKKLTVYNQKSHQGFLRHFIVRHSRHSDSYIALLLTHDGELPDREDLIQTLTEACPQLQGLVWGVNTNIADIARMEREAWRWGTPELFETLEELRFRVSPLSFFQVNTPAAEKLYGVIRELLGEDARSLRLLDAYCGAGSIGIFCAEKVSEIVGVEIVREAIWDARENARRNGVLNCSFLAGDMRDTLPLAVQTPGGPFGRVIMDPPRGGMDKRSLKGLLAIGAPVLVYVSCNPSTLARDLAMIVEEGYQPTIMQPVDLFPQTYHIETVIRFDKVEPPPRAIGPAKPKSLADE